MDHRESTRIKDLGTLIISILAAEGIGFIASALTRGSALYYQMLKKPFFAPPSWLFGVVWPILYLLMAISVYRVYMAGREGKYITRAIFLYCLQLFINFSWPLVFFRLNLFGIAFIVIIILVLFVIFTTIDFFRIDKISGLLMIPYILWLSYAAVLNYFIWLLNEA